MPTRADFHPEKLEEFHEAIARYNERRDGLGWDFMLCVEAAIDSAARSPETYAVEFENIRRVPVHRFPYSVYYEVTEHGINVVGVVHHSRSTTFLKLRIAR